MTASATVDLRGRRAIVTGGAGGIGAAIATRLAEAGAHVVVCDVDAAAANEVAHRTGGEAMPLDLSRTDELSRLSLETDILVNNAGIQHVAPIEDFDPQRFAFMLRLMVEAPFLLTRSVLPFMYRKNWGRIVHVSSVHGIRATAYKSAYVTAKHGLEGLSKVIALEGAAHGVTSNCVCPGYVRTPLVERQLDDQARVHSLSREEVVSDVLLQRSAVKRMLEPSEVADAVAYLCSPSAVSVTGSRLVLDGGWSAS